MQRYEIIIVGAGPAGASTALHLAALDPSLADRILLLDRAVFPRFKLCAGGVTSSADKILTQLDVSIDPPAVSVHTSKFLLPTGTLSLQQDRLFRIFRREEFDHQLFRATQKRGIVTRDGEALEDVFINPDGVIVRTTKNEYSSKVIIGADGANSTVRRLMGLSRARRVMMAIEIFAPLNQITMPSLTENMAVFDFTITTKGMPGYCWIFPASYESPHMVSLGILQSSLSGCMRIPLKAAFEQWLSGVVARENQTRLRARPIIQYEPRAICSQYRTLLVGDAAGVDSLFSEGITSALALGKIAATSSFQALRNGDFSFSDYERRIRSSLVGSMMRRRHMVARRFYNGYPGGRRQLKISKLLDWITPMSPSEKPSTVTWEFS